MTAPDKPEGTEPEGPAERTSVIAAGQTDNEADDRADDQAAVATPPPWQRVNADEQAGTAQDATQHLPVNGDSPSWPTAGDNHDAATVTVQRPVVSGSAAPRLFGGAPAPNEVQDSGVRTGGFGTGGLSGLGASSSPPSALRRPGRGPRRANLQIKRFDPWSVLKLSLVLGVALFFVWLVAVGALYAVLDGMGVWDKVNGISDELLNANTAGGGDPLISAGRVFGIAAIIGAINIVLFSALATVGAFVYNVSADLAGGLEVTLAERE
ncbi:DUF3566 domain-containing protein [Actinokineospora sp. UTMC 2448]|uniref:DUF3566 domain-containing protein n=1 Tax=Actinokineospora sp. UTMC 2448 TaxID=2268449 RepID=UPI0021FCCFD5|nr:hypothetical protein Actkin_00009 [Actinokineospora sp. UTMC 2448]